MTSKSLALGPPPHINLFLDVARARFCVTPQKAPAGTDLTGQVAIITGGNSGLGYAAAHHLLSLKLSRLIITSRSKERGEAAAKKLRAEFPKAAVDVWVLEMGSYSSIQDFARRVDAELPRLDITILNAGLIRLNFHKCDTGHEEIVQINYLSTFLLAILMLPVCKAKAPSGVPGRMTIVSSGTALAAKLPNQKERPFLASFDDPKLVPFDPTNRYFVSKLLGQLFFVRMLEYLNADDVIVNLVEPGLCKGSDLHRDAKGAIAVFMSAWKGMFGRTTDDGAWMYIYAAVTAGKESHGCFLVDWKIHPFANLVYVPEGKPVIDALWEETLADLEFAKVREILEASKKGETYHSSF